MCWAHVVCECVFIQPWMNAPAARLCVCVRVHVCVRALSGVPGDWLLAGWVLVIDWFTYRLLLNSAALSEGRCWRTGPFCNRTFANVSGISYSRYAIANRSNGKRFSSAFDTTGVALLLVSPCNIWRWCTRGDVCWQINLSPLALRDAAGSLAATVSCVLSRVDKNTCLNLSSGACGGWLKAAFQSLWINQVSLSDNPSLTNTDWFQSWMKLICHDSNLYPPHLLHARSTASPFLLETRWQVEIQPTFCFILCLIITQPRNEAIRGLQPFVCSISGSFYWRLRIIICVIWKEFICSLQRLRLGRVKRRQ